MASARLRCCERSVLALHDDAGRQVGDAHRGIGLVDVLAARARGAKRVDAQVGGIDLDFDRLVDFGIDEHAGERGMAARVRIEGALAHQAVHAGFGAQVAVGVVASDLDAGALDAGDLAVRLLEDLGLIALALAVAQVHAQQHRRPVLGLRAAASGLDVDEARVGIHRIGEHPAELHRRDDILQALYVTLDRLQRVIVPFGARELEQLAGILQILVEPGERSHHALELLLLLAKLLGPFLIGPDLRIFQVAGYRLQPLRLCVEVKDTSAGRQRAAASRRGCWRFG